MVPPGLLAISCRRNGDINILWHHAGQRPQTSDCHLSLFHLVVAQGRPPICELIGGAPLAEQTFRVQCCGSADFGV